MTDKIARLKYLNNSFEIIENGTHVICAVSGKKILLENLNYWNVDLQEPYFSYLEANLKREKINNFISIYYESISIEKDFLKSFFLIFYLVLKLFLQYLNFFQI